MPRVLLALAAAAVLPAPLRAGDLPVAACGWVRAENDGAGTGFVVDADRRWFVTCRHVVADRPTVDVYFPWVRGGELVTDRKAYLGNRPLLRDRGLLVTGKVLRRSDAADLALVELPSLPPGVAVLPLAKTPARPGDRLRMIGHRQDLDTLWNLTAGPVRQTGPLADGYHWRGQKLATDADVLIGQLPIEEGDSGGPAVTDRGEAAGVVVALRRRAPSAAVVVSAAAVRRFLDEPPAAAPPAPSPIVDTLTRATAWVRPTATDVHLAAVLVDAENGWLLTSARGLRLWDTVGVAFPRRENGRWVGERAAYRDTVVLPFRDGAWGVGSVIAHDPARDLALIRIGRPYHIPEQMKPVPVAAHPTAAGDAVHVMTHPAGLEFAFVYAAGVVRQRGRMALAADDPKVPVGASVLQVPAQWQSPGGPVLNDKTELVGVLAAKEGPQQVGYAADAAEIAAFLDAVPNPCPARTLEGLRGRFIANAERAVVDFARGAAASGDCDTALSLDPGCIEAYSKLFDQMTAAGRDGEASVALAAGLARGRYNRVILEGFGGHAYVRKDWRTSRAALERVLEVEPSRANTRLWLFKVLFALDKEDEAAAALRDLVRTGSGSYSDYTKVLLEQADELAKKYPAAPGVPARWLAKGLAAISDATTIYSSAAQIRAEIDAVLKKAAAAKTDADRLAVLRAYIESLKTP
jgi:S1-C subfamily serine protease